MLTWKHLCPNCGSTNPVNGYTSLNAVISKKLLKLVKLQINQKRIMDVLIVDHSTLYMLRILLKATLEAGLII
ncbi:CLUMA_CG006647, isoform A [Clunio marinus]|uniref:CLUMA_CG006647, isoform A n=1 Tax=Clunio marinus TaxID=568069 RepID=A0A1J1HYC9_9DIPT|nr:CLUMA_CG006647, isoform A [Clunio marinus]